MQFKKLLNALGTVIVVLVVALAAALAGVRVFGLKVFTVLSPSMEPAYHVGSVIYVKAAEPGQIREGDVITFVLNEKGTVATHRVVGITQGEDSYLRFTTKGDANDAVDGGSVHEKNVIGIPVFTIPYLGYIENFIHYPPGTYITIGIIAVLIAVFFLPEIINKRPERSGQK